MSQRRKLFCGFILCSQLFGSWPIEALAQEVGKSRITSIFLSEHFLNEQLKAHVKPGLLRDLNIVLDPKNGQIFLKGIVQLPVEELKALNLDPSLTAFRFQVTLKPETTRDGYLVLEFPLNETFFYPATSKNPQRDRVLIPVQMLSVALASARGYFAALSGDFSSFDRKTAKIKALMKALDHSIAREKNPDALDSMKTERESLKLQLAAIPLERKQMAKLAKQVEGVLGFTSEKELNLNEQFVARQNAIIIKLNIAKFVPYLTGVSLGGVRVVNDKNVGPHGENYFSVDINADLAVKGLTGTAEGLVDKEGLPFAPAAMIRINEALFESELIVSAEKKAMGSKLSDLKIELKQDGLHVSGKYHRFFFSIPFDTIVDFDSVENTDAFDVSVRDVEIAGVDLEFMTGFILESVQKRLDQSLKGICNFKYIGEKKDGSRALRVYLDPEKLIPALPGLHLVDVEVRDREFQLKVGKR
ncbi:MAG: hypothetical protein ACXVCY_08770 [Pseudobdellovibrionaceae bacterium]